MNADLTQLIISSLITGLVGIIGAVIGGLFAYKGSINAAKKQIDFLYAQETENRRRIETQQQEVTRQALIAEIKNCYFPRRKQNCLRLTGELRSFKSLCFFYSLFSAFLSVGSTASSCDDGGIF